MKLRTRRDPDSSEEREAGGRDSGSRWAPLPNNGAGADAADATAPAVGGWVAIPESAKALAGPASCVNGGEAREAFTRGLMYERSHVYTEAARW